jgi:CheY-like chemotaxis protein
LNCPGKQSLLGRLQPNEADDQVANREKGKAMRSATVLIIEDDAFVRTLLAQVLKEDGYQVCEADNGRRGVERFHAQPVDLVITDLEMPELNGLEVILALTRAFLDVKVIAMSGRAAEDLQKARLMGARQTFAKPLDLPALLYAVRYELQH